ncbi:MAG: iron ABC transporter permease [Alphaproteobacteria bacterium]|nr:iron ABC transporter permease [Alphaproteobacteria bacterium]
MQSGPSAAPDRAAPARAAGGLAGRGWPGPFAIFTGLTAVAIVFLVVYPLTRTLARVFMPEGALDLSAFADVFAAPWLPATIANTLIAVLGGGAVALVTASLFAWANERTDARLGLFGDILPLIPLLMPAVAKAIGWVFLASPGAGFLNGLIAATLGKIGLGFQINIMSWPGVIFVYALYFIPYVYLLVSAALRNVDPALEEASRISGAGSFATLRKVTLPAVKPALFGSALLIVIVGFSLYSVPVIIANRAGIDILSVRIIRLLTFTFPPRIDQAVVLSTLMLAAILGVWLIQRHVMASGNFATIGGKSARHALVALGPWKWVARAAMIFYVLATSVMPLGAILIVAFQPFWQPQIDIAQLSWRNFEEAFAETTTREGLTNSLMLGASGGLVGILLAAAIALYVSRNPGALSRLVDGVTKLPAALSHIVIAVGFLIAFSGPPLHLSGTFTILFLVYLVIYLPEASIAATAAVAQVGRDLMEASAVCGGSPTRTFFRVLIPLILPGLIAGWALLFVLMAGELTASSLLAGVGTAVIGFVILDIWEQGTFGSLAAIAGTYTLITATIVLVAMRFGRGGFRAQ